MGYAIQSVGYYQMKALETRFAEEDAILQQYTRKINAAHDRYMECANAYINKLHEEIERANQRKRESQEIKPLIIPMGYNYR